VGLELTIKAPEDLEVMATPAEFASDGEWRYPKKLFMPGEHLDIVWKRAGSPRNGSSNLRVNS
jgi:hypothetical protein